MEIRRPAVIPAALLVWPRRLHPGEREAIALAIDLQADLLLMDEDAGRAAATAYGLAITGIVGILLRAKRSRLVDEIGPLLDQLMDEAGFWVGSAFRREVLRLAGESSDA